MTVVDRDGDLERLISQAQIAQRDTQMADVIPDVSHFCIFCQTKRVLEATQRHVVLGGVEAAEADVVPDLCVVHAHL